MTYDAEKMSADLMQRMQDFRKKYLADVEATRYRSSADLQSQIQQSEEQFFADVPPELIPVMVKGTEDLIQAGTAERSLRVGEEAPDFSLPNIRGEEVKLSHLLARGPAVVTFYRGVW